MRRTEEPDVSRPAKSRTSALVLGCCLLAGAVDAEKVACAADSGTARTVLFVCEHGSAKSLLAATLFNQQAARRHLPYRAIARGTTPDAAPQEATREGLRKDGIDVATFVPQQVTAADVTTAIAVVSFEVDLAPFSSSQRPVSRWDDTPPVSQNYPLARDAILRNVDALIKQLQSVEAR